MATGPYDLGPFQTLSAINFAQGGAWEFIEVPTEGTLSSAMAFIDNAQAGAAYVADGGASADGIYLFDGTQITSGPFTLPVLAHFDAGGPSAGFLTNVISACVDKSTGDLWAELAPSGELSARYLYKYTGSWVQQAAWSGGAGADIASFGPSIYNTTNSRVEGLWTDNDANRGFGFFNGSGITNLVSGLPTDGVDGYAWNEVDGESWVISATPASEPVISQTAQVYKVSGGAYVAVGGADTVSGGNWIWTGGPTKKRLHVRDNNPQTTLRKFDGVSWAAVNESDISVDGGADFIATMTYSSDDGEIWAVAIRISPFRFEFWKFTL